MAAPTYNTRPKKSKGWLWAAVVLLVAGGGAGAFFALRGDDTIAAQIDDDDDSDEDFDTDYDDLDDELRELLEELEELENLDNMDLDTLLEMQKQYASKVQQNRFLDPEIARLKAANSANQIWMHPDFGYKVELPSGFILKDLDKSNNRTIFHGAKGGAAITVIIFAKYQLGLINATDEQLMGVGPVIAAQEGAIVESQSWTRINGHRRVTGTYRTLDGQRRGQYVLFVENSGFTALVAIESSRDDFSKLDSLRRKFFRKLFKLP